MPGTACRYFSSWCWLVKTFGQTEGVGTSSGEPALLRSDFFNKMSKLLFLILLVSGAIPAANSETVELITNGNFSQPISSLWTLGADFHADDRFTNSRSSGGYAYLANPDGSSGNNLYGEIGQFVTIPENATQATLSYWYRITTAESGSTAYDMMTLQVVPLTGNVVTLDTRSNADANSSYQERTVDLTQFKGKRIFVCFVASTDNNLPTTFRIDDVSILATVPVSTTPEAPANLNGSGFANYVYLWWRDNSSNETGFKVERKAGSGAWSQIDTTNANSGDFFDYATSPHTSYTYRVRAYNNGGNSGYSNEMTLTTPGRPPGAFTLTNDPPLWDASIQGPKVQLHWAPSANLTTYTLFRNGGLYFENIIGANFLNSAKLSSGATYTYFIRATNSDGSTDSNTVTVTMPTPTQTPIATVTSLTITGPTNVDTGSAGEYTAVANFSNGSHQDVTAQCTWTATGEPVTATGLSRTAIGTHNGHLVAGLSGASMPVTITATFVQAGVGQIRSQPFIVTIGESPDALNFGMTCPQIRFLRQQSGSYVWRVQASLYGSAFINESPALQWTLDGKVLAANGKDLDIEIPGQPCTLQLKAVATDVLNRSGSDSRPCVFNKPVLNEPGEAYPASDPESGSFVDSSGKKYQPDPNKKDQGLIILTHGIWYSGESWPRDIAKDISARLEKARKPVPNIAILDWRVGANPTAKYGEGVDDFDFVWKTLHIASSALSSLDILWPGAATWYFDLIRIRQEALQQGEALADWIEVEIAAKNINPSAKIQLILHR